MQPRFPKVPEMPEPATTDLLAVAVLDADHPAEARAALDAPFTPPARELARRVADGITVVLLWRLGDDGVVVDVTDARTGGRLHFDVAGGDAMDAFHHPFAYAA